MQSNFEQVAKKIRSSYDQAIDSTEIRMLQTATYVAADTEVQNLFLAGKLAVEDEGGGPGSLSFLRAHRPEKLRFPSGYLSQVICLT